MAVTLFIVLIIIAAIFIGGGEMIVSPKIKLFAQAIAKAEGFGANPSNLPTRCHNPGDLEIGDVGYGVDQLKTIFPDDATGWNALYKQVELIMDEKSRAGYSLTDTLYDFAKRYTGNDAAASYALNMANHLDISTDTTLGDYFA